MKLVIVESPAKTHTLKRYLGEEYEVMASVGHIRDLAIKGQYGYGVDIENGFAPSYSINKDKKKVVADLKKSAKKAEEVILATDPDREGEAIAWHLADVLGLDIDVTKRLEFHEITRESILHAMETPRTIDKNLVASQETRRIIDRIIGFGLSKITYKAIKSKSAGRVQSVTLKLICDHEKEIQAFIPQKFYTVPLTLENENYKVSLSKFKGEKIERIFDEKIAHDIYDTIGDELEVSSITIKKKAIKSKEPYTTSTLQQDAFNKYGFKTSETARLAQTLYEGVETNEGLVGLITYIRTDSTKLSTSFVERAKNFILETYGEDYFSGERSKKHVQNAQEAHEAIRQTSNHRTPELMKKYLGKREYLLYKLIYNRALSSLMSDKILDSYSVKMTSGEAEYSLEGSKIVFDGYSKVFDDNEKEFLLGDLKEKDVLKIVTKEFVEDETKPAPRYSEAKIVKLMEEKGIGRPSTYASTIMLLSKRKYVTSEKGILTPTEQGMKTTEFLEGNFSNFVNTEYTAEMEEKLDVVQLGNNSRTIILNDFYNEFQNEIHEYYNNPKLVVERIPLEKTGEKCPLCGSDLVIRDGRYGKFTACSNYPACKYIKKKELEYVGRTCPDCGGELVYRTGKKGRFISCSKFPKCHHVESIEKTDSDNSITSETKDNVKND